MSPLSRFSFGLLRIATALTLAALSTLECLGIARASVHPIWSALAACESSGNWKANTGNGFYGGLQFTASTWEEYGGARFASRADLASPAAQVIVAGHVLQHQGWKAWPICSRGVDPDIRISAGRSVRFASVGKGTYHANPSGILGGVILHQHLEWPAL
ncbi:transglycosylase family protein [Streptomyces noursei]|uniref:transglycosylase family protein n=1 Tax=Streptomyces noursei TaxID=1971 RepID=UPI000C9C2E0B|nr:transglycosylase family protein [Streptomyces noursei]